MFSNFPAKLSLLGWVGYRTSGGGGFCKERKAFFLVTMVRGTIVDKIYKPCHNICYNKPRLRVDLRVTKIFWTLEN